MNTRTQNFDGTVNEILDRWPQTARALMNFHTDCVGCRMARFCTLDDVARTYDLEKSHLVEELRKSITSLEGVAHE